jgi:hypothetical protein
LSNPETNPRQLLESGAAVLRYLRHEGEPCAAWLLMRDGGISEISLEEFEELRPLAAELERRRGDGWRAVAGSGHIAAYRHVEDRLEVRFKGEKPEKYCYFGVSEAEVADWLVAESPTRHLNHHIARTHRYERQPDLPAISVAAPGELTPALAEGRVA